MSPNVENYNSDELDAPEWLNADLFAKALINSEKDDDIVVQNLKLSPATVKGDHYASVMFRATVEYQQRGVEKSKSLIIKTLPEYEGHKKDMLHESHIFETEIGMYTVVVPKFEAILRAAGDDTILCANCVYYSLSPKKFIIFEDIVPLGFSVIRNRTFHLDEVKAAYLKLAKWHAISYKLLREDPKFFEEYRYGLMTLDNMLENDFIKNGLPNFLAILDTVPTLHEYKRHFEAMQPHLIQRCVDSFKEYHGNANEHAYYVLCHGDFHGKNMMFKHHTNSGKLEDLLLLDYQLSYVGPIVNDLIYSFYMLLNREQRQHHIDELLHYYFSNFIETLQKIGYKHELPKLEEFREQLLQQKYFELFLLTTFLPMWIAFSTGEADPDEMMSSEEYRKELYRNPEYIEELHTLLPRYLHKGYFDE